MGKKQVIRNSVWLAAQVAIFVYTADNLGSNDVVSFRAEVEQADLLLQVFMKTVLDGNGYTLVLFIGLIAFAALFVRGGIVFHVAIEVFVEVKVVFAVLGFFRFYFAIGGSFFGAGGIGAGIKIDLLICVFIVGFLQCGINFHFLLDALFEQGGRHLQQFHELNLLRR